MQHDDQEAVDFLRKLYANGPWVLTAIEVDGPRIHTESCGASAERVAAFLKRYADYGIYYSPNRPIFEEVHKKLDRESIEAVHYHLVDVDPRARTSADPPLDEHLKNEQARIFKLMQNPPQGIPRPTVCVYSGGGYQALWALEEPLILGGDLAKAEDAARYNITLELAYGADNCHNIDRILRLPGTINYPNAKKRAKGRITAQARLEWFDTDSKYPITAFIQAPVVQSRSGFSAAPGSRSPTVPRISGNLPRLASINDLPDTISAKIKTLIVQGKDPEEPGPVDRSRVVFAVCCALVRVGVDDGLIYSILIDPEYGISAHVLAQPAKDRYVLRQIERAKEHAIDPHLLELNAQHAVVENVGGRCRIIEEEADRAFGGRLVLTFQTFDDFRNRYGHRKVTCGFNNKGQPIDVPLGKWWLDQAARRQYRSITFSPGCDIEGAYNMWRGFAVEPRPGDKHQKFLDHVRDNLCNGNPGLYQYLMSWMARAVQKPDALGEVAVVLRGRKGTGKSLFVKTFGALFGRHFWQVSDARHMVGNFNAHLRDCLVLFADEAFWAGDKKHESVLKALITEETIVVERKGVDAEAAPNYVHLIMASNAQWVVPASEDERRFLVLDVAATRIQDKTYFGAIDADLKFGSRSGSLGDGYGHLLHALQTWDISNFDHRTVPHTDALAEQKIHSLETHEEWWFGKLRDGALQPMHAGWAEPIPKDQLFDDYLLYAQRIGGKRASATTVSRFLDDVCPGMEQWHGSFRGRSAEGDPMIGRTLWLRFPTLEMCRKGFEVKCGGPFQWPTIEERNPLRTQDPF